MNTKQEKSKVFSDALIKFVQNDCGGRIAEDMHSFGMWFLLHENGQWEVIDNYLDEWWAYLGDDHDDGINWKHLPGAQINVISSPISNMYYIDEDNKLRKMLLTYMKEKGINIGKKYDKYLK